MTTRRVDVTVGELAGWFTNVFAGLLVATVATIALVWWTLRRREDRW